MKLLIVNADDFGMTPGVTAGILEAHTHGVVTSTSMLVNTPFGEAAALAAREHPDLSVGLHACLTHEDGRPAIDFDDTDRCKTELHRQLERFTELMNRPPTHLDSHHHVHRDERLRPLFEELAAEISCPLREHSGVRHVHAFYGQWKRVSHPEQISAPKLESIIGDLESGISELSCHPGHVDPQLDSGYAEEREIELGTLCDPSIRRALTRHGIELLAFRDVGAYLSSLR